MLPALASLSGRRWRFDDISLSSPFHIGPQSSIGGRIRQAPQWLKPLADRQSALKRTELERQLPQDAPVYTLLQGRCDCINLSTYLPIYLSI